MVFNRIICVRIAETVIAIMATNAYKFFYVFCWCVLCNYILVFSLLFVTP